MFFGKKYDQDVVDSLIIKARVAEQKYDNLVDKWNDLIDQINDKGGKEFLNDGIIPNSAYNDAINDKDIKDMLMLCHPDKHGGSEKASRVTGKIILLLKK